MRLFIACLIIHGLSMNPLWYVAAVGLVMGQRVIVPRWQRFASRMRGEEERLHREICERMKSLIGNVADLDILRMKCRELIEKAKRLKAEHKTYRGEKDERWKVI